ncbi:MAG: SDR family oxidoreductase [Actinomycetota bacterium]
MGNDLMDGKVVLITGASSGLGYEAARALGAMGPRLYLVGRDRGRTEAAARAVTDATGNTDVHVLIADLSSQHDVKQLAAEFQSTGDPLHVLLNNAGRVCGFRREVSTDGIEMTFALNHLAYYTLTLQLLAQLEASAPARIVNTASDAYKDAKGGFSFDDYNAEQKYSPLRRYGQSKLANILFTRELARRIDGSGVTANACSPPRLTKTGFAHNVHPLAKVALRLWPFSLSAEQGAQSLIQLCSAPDLDDVSGTYWSGLKQPTLRPAATSDEDARRLWELSASLTGVDLAR